MDDDTTDAAWHQLELEARREAEDWQALLAADPAYLDWLDTIDSLNRKETRS